MFRTSEWVSLGHPDKTADFISCFLLDRFLEKDPMTRYALEVMIKDNIVTLGGEITSKASYSDEDIAAFVRVAVNQIGYTQAYQRRSGKVLRPSGGRSRSCSIRAMEPSSSTASTSRQMTTAWFNVSLRISPGHRPTRCMWT